MPLAGFNAYLAALRKVVAFRIYFGFLLNQKIDRLFEVRKKKTFLQQTF